MTRSRMVNSSSSLARIKFGRADTEECAPAPGVSRPDSAPVRPNENPTPIRIWQLAVAVEVACHHLEPQGLINHVGPDRPMGTGVERQAVASRRQRQLIEPAHQGSLAAQTG